MRPPREDTEPWYKQFWPWFLISLPLSVVIASMITINLAIKTSDGLVSDDYYKEGLAIKVDASRTARAQALNLAGELAYTAESGALLVALSGDLERMPPTLTLTLDHATIKDRDQTATLTHAGNGRYVGRVETLSAGDWKLRLFPEDEEWRIKARLPMPGDGRITLQ
jgi:hypothetical protein